MKLKRCTNTSTINQRAFILDILKNNSSFNTLEFREVGICSPAPRVKELRDRGYIIDTYRVSAIDSAGTLHPRIAKYVLKQGPTFTHPLTTKKEAEYFKEWLK